jgi:hypothetical protein
MAESCHARLLDLVCGLADAERRQGDEQCVVICSGIFDFSVLALTLLPLGPYWGMYGETKVRLQAPPYQQYIYTLDLSGTGSTRTSQQERALDSGRLPGYVYGRYDGDE